MSAEPAVPAEPEVPEMVDWELAVRLGSRIAGDGPPIGRDEADAVVAELREGAERSTGLVREFTGLAAAERTAPVLVVDRAGWVQANADAFRAITEPLVVRTAEAAAAKGRAMPTGLSRAVGSRVTGVEVGGLLGFLSSKVLGQFDPFHDPAGRLLLVAPNIVHVERELGVDPHDFRLWVCLHEETHRVQFTAVPWMRAHLYERVETLSSSLEPSGLLEDGGQRLLAAAKAAVSGEGGSIVETLATPEQREILDGVTGMMSLLEGHADVVMDGVGPEVIPSVGTIRRRFNQRRKGVGTLDKVLRRLLGLEAKMAQYRDGAAFVRGVVDEVGMERFNAVWAAPENLPTKAEVIDHRAWMNRVL